MKTKIRNYAMAIFSIVFLAGSYDLSAKEYEAFGVGEQLYYRIHWKNVTGGYAKVEIKEKKMFRGREVYHIKSYARSGGYVESFFKVRDYIQCYWDIERRQPLRTVKNMSEGNYKRIYKADFYPGQRRATYWEKEYKGNSNKLGETNPNARWEVNTGGRGGLPVNVQDVVSAMYMMRADSRRGNPGERFTIKVYDDKKLTSLTMLMLSRETIKTKAGKTYRTIKVKPLLRTTGFFKSTGDIYVWVSDDKYKIPVKVQAGIPLVGNVTVELVKHVKHK